MPEFTDDQFKTSSFSGGDAGTCVEVALTAGAVGVRDSKNPSGAVLSFTSAEWHAFVAGVKQGEFDQ